MTNAVVAELKSAVEWFSKHGRNTNTAIIGICNRAIEVINNQKSEIDILIRKKEALKDEIAELQTENDRLRKMECLVKEMVGKKGGGEE